MSIDCSTSVMIGLKRRDIEDKELLYELIEKGEIEGCPPWYDGRGVDDEVVGFCYLSTPSYTPKEFEWNPHEISALKSRFEKLIGQEAKIWISPRDY